MGDILRVNGATSFPPNVCIGWRYHWQETAPVNPFVVFENENSYCMSSKHFPYWDYIASDEDMIDVYLFICGLFNDAFIGYTLWCRMMNWKGFGRKQLWPNQGIILQFAWRNWGKPRKPSVRIADVPAKIRTEQILNASEYFVINSSYISNISLE
jgi:hypothetical protein